MKKFVKGLVTNRFGIVLATLSVCYFVYVDFSNLSYRLSNSDNLMLMLHTPAAILTLIPFSYRPLVPVIFLFSVTLQWLFIGWAAKTIAQRIQPNRY